MTGQSSASPALVCTQCHQTMSSPVCCASCGALNPVPLHELSLDYFELFGIPRGFDLDTQVLHHKYLALCRAIHPDTLENRSGAGRQQSLALSAQVNRAYETLRKPIARAEYLLTLAGGPSAGEDKSVPPELLAEIMMLREEIDEAVFSQDAGGLQALRQQITRRREATLTQIADLCRSMQNADGNDRRQVHQQLRERLNTVKYWNNLLEQLPAGSSA